MLRHNMWLVLLCTDCDYCEHGLRILCWLYMRCHIPYSAQILMREAVAQWAIQISWWQTLIWIWL
jgi:hypothetical protein